MVLLSSGIAIDDFHNTLKKKKEGTLRMNQIRGGENKIENINNKRGREREREMSQ